jgi:NitT/TauT family transport system ATP-binding protein
MFVFSNSSCRYTSTESAGVKLKIQRLTKGFPGQLLFSDFSMEIEKGLFVAVMGPSGCGKSTLLKVIAGLLKPDKSNGESEEVLIDDLSPVDYCKQARIGMAFQTPTLFPWRTAFENVKLPLEVFQGQGAEASTLYNSATSEALEASGLSKDFWSHRPSELSGGMSYRVALARAVVGKPKLILLDEPFTGLDEFSRQQLNHNLQARLATLGFPTTIMVTHSLADAVFLADYLLVLDNDTNAKVFPNPLTKTERSFRSDRFLELLREWNLLLFPT